MTHQDYRENPEMDTHKLDEKVLQELQLELRWMPGVDVRNVAVKATVKAGVAILFGHVSDPSVRRVAEQVARRVLGIRSVINEIKLHHPTSESDQDVGHSRSTLDAFGSGQQSP